ncbi:NAD(P)-binding protein [Aulographum hederae CBS 113979]|uniref:NAD(P)-binding protein n=1 Tax=Aulographum hederae CBS 113979 TaxID=1176131 RepID=A0A6G1HCL9_9PEZI|nr:NAD(P)-binding protein [Aulographum hederae CBS 113979]
MSTPEILTDLLLYGGAGVALGICLFATWVQILVVFSSFALALAWYLWRVNGVLMSWPKDVRLGPAGAGKEAGMFGGWGVVGAEDEVEVEEKDRDAKLQENGEWTDEDVKRIFKEEMKKVEEGREDEELKILLREGMVDEGLGDGARKRRYVVVGGSGLVGRSIVKQLLLRGQPPDTIRIIDIRPPGPNFPEISSVPFVKADITSQTSTSDAYSAPWPSPTKDTWPLTVFHTAAIIRPGDRTKATLPLSSRVNVDGVAHSVAAAKSASSSTSKDPTIFISTSSATVTAYAPEIWLPPWKRWPKHYIQVIESKDVSVDEEDFADYSNYAITKSAGERIVRKADDGEQGFRTGVLRPGCAVYGAEDDSTVGNMMKTGGTVRYVNEVVLLLCRFSHLYISWVLFRSLSPPVCTFCL